jgi:hypothetical protein
VYDWRHLSVHRTVVGPSSSVGVYPIASSLEDVQYVWLLSRLIRIRTSLGHVDTNVIFISSP